MGGGDLNMKKHFHPLTRENLEKVWLAEKKRDEELKRIEERKKEIAEERAREELLEHASRHGVIKKREERLEWMYAGYRTTSDDFLLGKEVTDEFIQKAAEERRVQQLARQTGVEGVLHTVDMARKIREDPLFVVKKREAMTAKNLLQNSARLKQLIESSRRDSRHASVVTRRTETPRADKLGGTGWDTPSRQTPRYEERSHRSHKHRSPSLSDEEENQRKLKQMLDNGKWRESTRKHQVEGNIKEEILDQKIEEHLRRLKGAKSNINLLSDIKMGTWSSKRYTQNKD